MKYLPASMTVEAAFVVPTLILLMGLVIQTGISLYTETKTMALDLIEEEDWDAAGEFSRRNMIAEKLQK